MKIFLRAMSGFLLVVILTSFTMWRQNTFPDLSGITNFVMDTAGRLNHLTDPNSAITAGGRPPADANAGDYEYTLSEELNPELEKRIYDAMMAREAEVDVADFNHGEATWQSAISTIRFLHPDLFFVDKTFHFVKNETGAVQLLKPRYLYGPEETQAKLAEYNSYVQAIVAGAPANGSDFDKLLYLHDYFVREYSYDYSYTIRDAYTFFTQKTGVCQAYMLALIAVTAELGIESIPVTSNRMNHAWNLVKLEDSWYHVDITWDDAVSYPSYTSYAYFLQSDVGIVDIDSERIDESMAEPNWHCDWETTQNATDTRYDNAVWRSANTPMVKGGDMYFCVVYTGVDVAQNRSGAIYAGESPAAMSEFRSINSIWRLNGGSQYYMSCYTGLVIYGDLLIYNTHNSLRAYSLQTGNDRQLTIFDNIGTDCIYGLSGVSQSGTVSCVVSAVASGGMYYLMDYTVTP